MSDSSDKAAKEVPLTLAVMSDIHVRETDRGRYRGLFREISGKADVLAVCGDLTDRGLPDEARTLLAELEACSIPVVGVLGNHDHDGGQVEELIRILSPRFHFLEEDGPRVIGGVGFAGVKGFCGGFDRRRVGPFGEASFKAFMAETLNDAWKLEAQLQSLETLRKVAVLHYAPISATVAGEPPELYPFLGCSLFEEVIDGFDVAAVFHGHAHYGTFAGRTPRGIPVYNCAYEILRRRNPRQPYLLLTV